MAKFSFFKHPASNTVPYKNIDLVTLYEAIRNPKWIGEKTAQYRRLTSDKNRRIFKAQQFDYACFSGTFTTRSAAGLKEHSGLMCLDFDHLSDVDMARYMLLDDKNIDTQMLFTSPSGDGLKWVVAIDVNKFSQEQWYTGISNYVKQTYGLLSDMKCKDVARACFIPHDPDVYIKPSLLPQIQEFDETGLVATFAERMGATQLKLSLEA